MRPEAVERLFSGSCSKKSIQRPMPRIDDIIDKHIIEGDDIDLFELAEGEINVRKPEIITAKKTLIISDIHIPYHDKTALSIALREAKKEGVDTIILNGDIIDFYQVSSWNKTPNKATIQIECEMAVHFFTALRRLFPDVVIYYTEGNHEDRLTRYVVTKAPELFSLGMITTANILKLSDFNIKWVDQFTRIELGQLNVVHGHQLQGSGINVAQNKFRKAKSNIIFGHHHTSQNYIEKTFEGKVVGAWAVGCLSDLSPDYCPNNNWVNGFAIVDTVADGSFTVNNYKIIDGQIH
tara:strand:- start:8287 stop:9168 length:882 start_codon:yes stop_codon:yes gene_type:complete